MGQQPIAAPQANNDFQLDTSFDKVVQTAEAIYRKTQIPFVKTLYDRLVKIQTSVKDLARFFNRYRDFNRVTVDRLKSDMSMAFQFSFQIMKQQGIPQIHKELIPAINNYNQFIRMNEKL
jgi:RNA recognition motif-containing protein